MAATRPCLPQRHSAALCEGDTPVKILDTTAGSTHAVNVAVLAYMPPAEAATVLAICDLYQAQQTELQHLRARQPDPTHARQCRTTELELPISKAIKAIRARLEVMHQTFRVSTVLNHLWKYRAKYGITRLPTRAVVQRVLIKHGLYAITC